MSAESLLNSALLADAGVTALVDSGINARIYADFLKQEIGLPAVVFQREETEYVTTIHSGASLGTRVVMETWCLADSRLAAEELADAVEAALPAGGFVISGRRPEFNPENETFSTVISSFIWL
jgi:hypothetical protein